MVNNKMKKQVIKVICFDIDNVICRTEKNIYSKSLPNIKSINKINELYEKGYQIKIFTARFMGRYKDDIRQAKKRGLRFTEKQLIKWGVKYHKLIFGKPSYDLFVDDKSIFYKKNWYQKIDNIINNKK